MYCRWNLPSYGLLGYRRKFYVLDLTYFLGKKLVHSLVYLVVRDLELNFMHTTNYGRQNSNLEIPAEALYPSAA